MAEGALYVGLSHGGQAWHSMIRICEVAPAAQKPAAALGKIPGKAHSSERSHLTSTGTVRQLASCYWVTSMPGRVLNGL